MWTKFKNWYHSGLSKTKSLGTWFVSLLLADFNIPSILQKILLAGSCIFVPVAIGVGVTVMPPDAKLAIWWFHAAAGATTITIFLWEEVVKLGRLRIPVTALAVSIVLFSLWESDSWVLRKVNEVAASSISQDVKDMKEVSRRFAEDKKRKNTNSASITEDLSALHQDKVKVVVHRKTETASEVAAKIAEEKELPSTDADLPFGLEVTLVANRDISPVALELQFTGEVGKFLATEPIGAFEQQQGGIIVQRPNTVLMERKSPAFTAQLPIIVWVYSRTRIATKKLSSVPFNFPYPQGYLR
jgi:hypothetical protein